MWVSYLDDVNVALRAALGDEAWAELARAHDN